MLPVIENGHVVVRLDGELDAEGAATVARVIGQSQGDFELDFSGVASVDDAGLEVVAAAIRQCPYRLALRGLADARRLV
jgi:anti-anti-sigma regulatory factor